MNSWAKYSNYYESQVSYLYNIINGEYGKLLMELEAASANGKKVGEEKMNFERKNYIKIKRIKGLKLKNKI